MKYGDVRRQVAALAVAIPPGFKTWDANGEIVIDSSVPVLEWFTSSQNILRNGSPAEREALLRQLNRSVRSNAGLMHELALAAYNPEEK